MTGKRSKKRVQEVESLSDDEVERYHSLKYGNDDGPEIMSDSSSEAEEVLQMKDVSDDSESEESSDQEDASDDETNRIGSNWGKKRSNYFKQGDESESEVSSDEEAAMQEEEAKEATRLQKQKRAMLRDTDFDLDDIVESKSKGTKGKKKVTPTVDKSDLDRIASQAPELLGLLSEFRTHLDALANRVQPVMERVSDVATENGLSYLDAKFHALLTYCINIAFYLLLKAEGQSVKDHPVIGQLVRMRSVLEKLKPLDVKLKKQIDDILKSADGAVLSQSKPRPGDLVADDNSDDDSEEDDNEEDDSEDDETNSLEDGGKSLSSSNAKKAVRKPVQTYVVPKVAAVTFEDDEKVDAKRAKRDARLRRKMQNNEMLKDLRSEFSDRPAEFQSIGVGYQDVKNRQVADERRRYEEENFVRLMETKKDKKLRNLRERQAMQEFSNFGDLDDFSSLENLVKHAERNGTDHDDRTRKEQELQRFIHKMEQDAKKESGKKQISGDSQVALRDPMEINLIRTQKQVAKEAQMLAEKAARKAARAAANDDDIHVDPELEDDFYRESSSKAKNKAKTRKEVYTFPTRMTPNNDDTLEYGEKRKASYKILKNKGLQPHKKKEDRNPRVKKRKQYEAKLKARQGQVKNMRAEGDSYGGESSGLRTQIVASRRPGK